VTNEMCLVAIYLCDFAFVCVCVTTHNSAAKSELRVDDLGGQRIIYPLTIHYLNTGNEMTVVQCYQNAGVHYLTG